MRRSKRAAGVAAYVREADEAPCPSLFEQALEIAGEVRRNLLRSAFEGGGAIDPPHEDITDVAAALASLGFSPEAVKALLRAAYPFWPDLTEQASERPRGEGAGNSAAAPAASEERPG